MVIIGLCPIVDHGHDVGVIVLVVVVEGVEEEAEALPEIRAPEHRPLHPTLLNVPEGLERECAGS